ncbi:uncharacterized protein [Littorina saxatilis]|uniref:uncharacterized protein isoform X2 n=1 Tax=Littorina saxatilis TaxID=31220 RepID=UPI0038B69BFD
MIIEEISPSTMTKESQEDTVSETERSEETDLVRNDRMSGTAREPNSAHGSRERESTKNQRFADTRPNVKKNTTRIPNTADGSRERRSITSSASNLTELVEFDRETQLDLEVLRFFESERSEEISSDQLSSTCCYGRGKCLTDITLPRLPKKFQKEGFAGGDVNMLDILLESQFRTRTERPVGCGRGKLLEMQSSTFETDLGALRNTSSGTEQEETSTTSQDTHKNPTKPTSLLLDSRVDCEFYSVPTQPTNYNSKSQDDFPALSAGSSTNTRLPSLSRTKRGRGKQKAQQKDSIPPEAFQDAEDPTRDALALSVLTQQTSEAVDVALNSKQPCSSKQNEESLNSLSFSTDEEESSEPAATSEMKIDGKSARAESFLKMNKNNSYAGLSESDLHSRTSSQDALNVEDIDDENLKQKEGEPAVVKETMDKKAADCQDQQTREDGVVYTGKAESEENGEALVKLDSNKNSIKTQEGGSKAGESSNRQAKGGGASAPETKEISKTKKKVYGSWKLDGPLVLQVENVPKNCGGELKDYLAAFGKIVDSEKKSQKGANVWRFMFEKANDCDYAVSCLHGADSLFEGHSSQLVCHRLGKEKDPGTPV